MKNNTRGNRKGPFQLSTLALAVSMGIAGAASADTLSIQGSWLDFEPGRDARTYAIECFDCDDTSNIKGFPYSEHESNFTDNLSGAFKWTHELDGRGLWGTDDFAIGGSYFKDDTKTNRFGSFDSINVVGTPYGTLDSSSGDDPSSNKDEAWFATGDVEFGWNRQHGDADVRYFVGLRTEYMEYERDAMQYLSSSNIYNGEEKSEFFGIGPRIGVSIKQPVGASKKFAVIGSVSGGIMYGHLERNFNVKADTDAKDDLPDDSGKKWVPFADAEVGLSYQINDATSLVLGYQVGYQDNIIALSSVCTDDYDDDVKPYNDSCGNDLSSAMTHGAYLRAVFEF